jgi:hypothetical protein
MPYGDGVSLSSYRFQLTRSSCDLGLPTVPGQVDRHTPPTFPQFVDPHDSALNFPIRRIVRSEVPRYINDHAGEIVANRSREIEPIPGYVQRGTNLFGVL